MRYFLFIVALTSVMFACKPNSSNTEAGKEESTNQKLTIVADSTVVGWTAYKTTEKIPVKGVFQSYEFKNLNEEGTSIKEVLNGASLSIAPSSVFSKDSSRDAILRNFFFDKLLGDINATLTFEGDNAFLNIDFNNVQNKLPVTYNISDNVFTLESSIDLKDYSALDALGTLHEECKDKHTGPDGVSKTWEEVGVNGKLVFAKQ